MRILQINSAKNFGGGERHVVDLTAGLIDRGHELFLAVDPHSPITVKLGDLPAKNVLQTGIKNALDIFAARRIAKFVRKNRIEIIHAHTGKDYLPASLALRFGADAGLVLTRHVVFPLKFVHKYTLRNVARVIAVSAGVESVLQRTFSPSKVRIVPNGVDVGSWELADRGRLRREFRQEYEIPVDAKVLGTVGELKHLKGPQDFILSAQIIAKQHPDVYFIIVGKDNSLDGAFRRSLKRLVKVFDLEQRFIWFDWIEDTKPLYAALDVFVSPSHSESFGLAILEALSAGCPSVATDTAGARELIIDDFNGMLTPVKEPARLADAICEVLEDADKLVSMGKNARKRAVEEFGLDRMILETEKIYSEIMMPES